MISPGDRFGDEWLRPLIQNIPGVTAERVAQWRAERRPYLSQAVVESGLAEFDVLGRAVQKAFGIGYAPLTTPPDKATLAHVPEKISRMHQVLPVRVGARQLELAMMNPLDDGVIQAVGWATNRTVVPLYCPPSRLDELMRGALSPEAVIYDLLRRMESPGQVEILGSPREDSADEAQVEVRAPVIRLVNAIIADAVNRRASDIHIEHDDQVSIVRYRIDGLLRKVMVLPRYLGVGPVVARVKIMARLDISDRMRPQDGRAKLRVNGEEIGLRVSTLPMRVGEKVVIRILNERAVRVSLEALGFAPALLPTMKALLERKQGMFLVTGPTGSGKTTTLYAALNHLRSETVNIVTVEDPIEYKLAGINQVHVNEKQGLTFASVLRSVLRQDPDIVFVGEIRDAETASVAIQAAMTGHLVLSTLHTNDTVGAMTRLADLGVEPFHLSGALLGVSAQRLVRRVCPECSVTAPWEALAPALREALIAAKLPQHHVSARGRAGCGFAGYVERFPVTELLAITPAMRGAISRGEPEEELRATALRSDALHGMEYDCLWHLANGNTTQEEILPHLDKSRLGMGEADARAAEFSMPDEVKLRAEPETSGSVALVAAKDAEFRRAAAAKLEADGLLVHSAEDGSTALSLAARTRPDLLIVELELPVLDGLQVIQLAKSALFLDTVSVVLLPPEASGREQELLAQGASDIVVLPASPEEISERALSALQRKRGWSETADVMRPPVPLTEGARIGSLRQSRLLDSPPEDRFDKLTKMAQRLFNVPVALVSLVDEDRQWFKSNQGFGMSETVRDVSFCAHAINSDELMVVPDAALDPRFAENPLVIGDPNIRFYAGYPLKGPGGHNIGTLCVIDSKPRVLSQADEQSLKDLGAMVEAEIARG